MCLIIRRPSGIVIPNIVLKTGFPRNNDGWGIMYAKQNKIHVQKGMRYEELLDAIENVPIEQELFVHLRMATHGDVCEDNTHPFKLDSIADSIYMMHNGVLNFTSTNIKSDTKCFAEYIQLVVSMLPDIVFSTAFEAFIDPIIGSDRLIFLKADGTYVKFGTWNYYEGVELSNTYAWSPINYGTSYYGSNWYDEDDYLDYTKSYKKTKPQAALSHFDFFPDNYQYPTDHNSLPGENTYMFDPIVDSNDTEYKYKNKSLYDLTIIDLQAMDYDTLQSFVLEYPEIVANMIYDSNFAMRY